MRAIAILLVIAAHFGIPGFSAGFIGVDIFFVISGYLITSILVREYDSHGRINLPRFYANRLRRLFPALAVMVIVSSAVAYYLLPPMQQIGQSHAAAAAIIWLSNVYFTFADVDYFGQELASNAFLHTWSLGVEEQFYLIWPLLLLLALGLTAKLGRRLLPTTLGVVFIASLAACLWLAPQQPNFAFYMMPTRAWQFAAGGLTWLLLKQARPTQAHAAGAAGLALLLLALLTINPHTLYPSVLALLPTLATCTLLWAGTALGQITQRLLSLSWMQRIGGLSYSWYLWHWPVLVIGEELLPIKGHAGNTLLALALSLALAWLTHRFLENPIRFGKPKQWLPRWQIGAALVLMVLFNSQILRWYNSTQNLLIQAQENSIYLRAAADMPVIYQHGCDEWYHNDEVKPCSYGQAQAPKTAVLMGDSIGAQWFNTIAEIHDPQEWRLLVLTKSSCPMVEVPFFYERIGREYTECQTWRRNAIAWLNTQKIDRLFLGGTASPKFSDQELQEGTAKVLAQFEDKIPAIYLIEANPTLGFNGPDCLMKYQASAPEKCAQGRADNSRYRHVAELLQKVTTQYEHVHWIETASAVCPKEQCSALHGDTVVFRDSQHLTASFTTQAAPHFLKQVQQYEVE